MVDASFANPLVLQQGHNVITYQNYTGLDTLRFTRAGTTTTVTLYYAGPNMVQFFLNVPTVGWGNSRFENAAGLSGLIPTIVQ